MKGYTLYCQYYQATVLRKKTWFLSACLRNESNVVFARSLDAPNNIFEFFVPSDQEEFFLDIMKRLQEKGIILSLEKKENRLKSKNIKSASVSS